MDEPDMMQAHTAGLSQDRFRRRQVEPGSRCIDGPAKDPIRVMIEDGTRVGAGQNHQRPVVLPDVVKKDSRSEDVVVGVGVKCPVLMPLYRRAVPGSFQIDLAGMETQVRADELTNRLGHAGRSCQLHEERVVGVGELYSADARIVGPMAGLKIIDAIAGRDTAGAGDEVVDNLAKPIQLIAGQRLFLDKQQGCFKCHGADGRGGIEDDQSTKDAWGQPIIAANLTTGSRGLTFGACQPWASSCTA